MYKKIVIIIVENRSSNINSTITCHRHVAKRPKSVFPYMYEYIEISTNIKISHKINLVSVDPGQGFKKTIKLKIIKFKQAIQSEDKENQIRAINEEQDRVVIEGTF